MKNGDAWTMVPAMKACGFAHTSLVVCLQSPYAPSFRSFMNEWTHFRLFMIMRNWKLFARHDFQGRTFRHTAGWLQTTWFGFYLSTRQTTTTRLPDWADTHHIEHFVLLPCGRSIEKNEYKQNMDKTGQLLPLLLVLHHFLVKIYSKLVWKNWCALV